MIYTDAEIAKLMREARHKVTEAIALSEVCRVSRKEIMAIWEREEERQRETSIPRQEIKTYKGPDPWVGCYGHIDPIEIKKEIGREGDELFGL